MANSSAVRSFNSDDDDSDAQEPAKPERNLLAAVLSRAICDAFGSAYCERHVVRSARQWLFGTLDAKKIFSFAWVATHLDLDPFELQMSLRAYEKNPEEVADRLALLK